MASVPGYGYYKKLTTQEAQISVGTNSLANFPVLVRITDNDLKSISNGGKVQNINGYDIVFTTSNGSTTVNQQLESYDPIAGALVAWVQLPAVSATLNTDFYMYFGNSAVVTNPSTNLTWDPNFKGVWHLNGNRNDATNNAINLTSTGTASLSPGLAASAENIPLSSYLSNAANSAFQITGDLSLETWVNFNSVQANIADNFFIASGDVGESGPDNYNYLLNLIGTGADANKLHMYWEYGAGTDVDVISTVSVSPTPGVWHHVAVVRDNTNNLVTFYFDGVQVGTSVSFVNPPNQGTTATFRMGEDQNTASFDIDAGFDEARVSNMIRIPEWMQATYQSNQTGSTFVSYGTTFCVPPDISVVSGNQTVCISTGSAVISGNTPTIGVGSWSQTAGTGSISNAAASTVTVSNLIVGQNIFSWTITNGTCTSVSSVTIQVDPLNSPALVSPLTQVICSGTGSAAITATAPGIGSGSWSIVSGGGTLGSTTANSTTVTGLSSAGTTVIKWNVASANACPSNSTSLSIQVDPLNSAALVSPLTQVICAGTGSAAITATAPGIGSGSWSIVSGGGTLGSTTANSTTVTGLSSAGTTVIKWNVASANACPSNSTSLSIQVDPLNSPALVSPLTQIICAGTATAAITATAPGIGSGSWSIVSGGGTLGSTTANSTTVTGLSSAGTTVIKWNVASANACPSNSTSLSIQVDPLNSAALVSPITQTICAGTGSAAITATAPVIGSGSWSILSGGGTLGSTTANSTTVTGLSSAGTTVIKWNVASANACPSNSTSLSIQVDPLNSSALVSPLTQIICAGTGSAAITSTAPGIGSGSWSILSGGGTLGSTTANSTTVTGLSSAGTTVIKWNVASANACPSNSTSLSIQVDPLNSPAQVSPITQVICAGTGSAAITATAPVIGSGSWSILSGGGTLGSTTANSTTITGLNSAGTTIVQWNVATGNTCPSNSTTLSIQVDPLNSPALVSPLTQVICAGTGSAAITSTAPGIGSGSWSILSGGGTLGSTTANSTTVTGLSSAGTTVIKWNVASANACPSNSTSLSIQVDPLNSAALVSPLTQVICAGTGSAAITATAPVIGSGSWSILSGGGTLGSTTANSTTITGLNSAGTTIVQWNVATGNTCPSNSTTLSIQVDPLNSAALVSPITQTICAGTGSAAITATAPGIGSGSWSILSGGGTLGSTTANSTTVTGLNSAGTTVVQWNVATGNTCPSNSTTLSIQVDPLNSAALVSPITQVICAGTGSAAITATAPVIGSGSWSILSGGGTLGSTTANSTTVTGLNSAGTTVVQWNVATGNTCPSNSTTLSIQVDPLNSAALVSPITQVICAGTGSAAITATAPVIGSGSWSIVSGGGTLGSTTANSTTVTGLNSAGTTVVQWNVATGNTCPSNSTTLSITVDPLNSPAQVSPLTQTICAGTASAAITATSPAIGTGAWSIVSGGGTLGSTTANSTTVTGLSSAGTTVVKWTVSAPSSCPVNTATLSIVADPLNSSALVSPISQSICVSTASAAISSTLSGPGTGSWSIASGGGTLTSTTASSTTVTGLTSAGTTIINYSVISGNTCPGSSATLSIQVDPLNSPAQVSPLTQTICAGTGSAVLTSTAPAVGTGSWSIVSGGGALSATTGTTNTITGLTSAGTTIVRWRVVSGNTCSSHSATTSIIVDPLNSPAQISPSQTICASTGSAIVTATAPTIGTGAWSIISGGGASNVSGPTNTVTGLTSAGTTIVKWTVSALSTCPANTATMSIQVDPANSAAQISPNQTICALTASAIVTATNPVIGTGAWSILSGGGANNVSGTTNTVTGLSSAGTTVVRWTVSAPSSCPANVATMSIQVDPANSAAQVSPNQTICASTGSAVVTATAPTTGTGAWSIFSGAGTNNPSGTTNTVTGLTGAGTTVVKWTVSAASSCPANSTTLSIHVDPTNSPAQVSPPTQTICASTASAAITATNPVVGTGAWSIVSGGGTLGSTTANSTTITGLSSTGTTVVKWTVSAPSSCPANVATMTIQVDPTNSPAQVSPLTQTICASTGSAAITATAPGTGTGAWSIVSGGGALGSTSANSTTVTGLSSAGTTIIKWTVSAPTSCAANTATMSIQVDPLPTTATVVANQTICVNTPTVTLIGSTPSIGTGSWTLVSGTGSINSTTNPTTAVTNLTAGTSVFRWTINNNSSCPSSSATTSVKVDQLSPVANAGSNQTLCTTGTSSVMAATPLGIGSGTWSLVSGAGTVVSLNSVTSPYFGVTLGLNVFRWTTSNGVCPTNTSTMSVEVDNGPMTALPGVSQTICANTASTAMAANTPTPFSGIGAWTLVSGTGTITSVNNASTTITNLGTGVNVFRWTIANVCGTNNNTMSIQVDQMPAPVANAGGNLSVCNVTTSASPTLTLTLNGNPPTVGTGSWTVLTGTATIGSPTTPNATITSQNAGDNILQWSISNGVCPVSTSTMDFHVDNNQAPPSAGPDQTICISTPSTNLAATQTTAGTSSWASLGPASVVTPTSATTQVTNLILGPNIFQWNGYNGLCLVGNDIVNIIVEAAPTTASVSTANQTVCSTGSVTSVSANSSTVSGETQTWSFVQGGGIIANPTLATTAVTLNIGNNVLQWSIGNGGACANSNATVSIWVVNAPSTANAGSNQTVCVTTGSTTLAAATPTGGIGTWSVMSGGGTVTTPTLTNSTITGLTTGTTVLKWTLSSPCPGGSNSQTMSIQVDAAPTTASITTANQTVCAASGAATLAAVALTVGTGSWTVLSGAGSFTSTTNSTTRATGLTTGTTNVQWKTTNGSCSSTFSRSIVVDPAPTTATTAGNQSICISTGSTVLTGNIPSVGSGSWTGVGSGTILTPTLGTSTITALTTGTTTLTWKISSGVCAPSTSTMQIITYALPGIANAGSNQIVCATAGTAALAATAPSVGTGAWTVLFGSGSVAVPSSATSSVTGLTAGTSTLQWAITNGACSSATTMVIQVDASPTIPTTAGNQSVCITTLSTTLTGNIPTVGTGSWTILSGSGSVTTPSLGNSPITGLVTGTTVLRWSTTNGVCTSNSPTMNIVTFDVPGVAFAGSNQTICVTTGSTVLAATAPTLGTGSWLVVSGTGTVTNPASPTSTVTGLTTGTTVLKWTIQNGACTDAATVAIQVDSAPTTASAGANQSLCITSPITMLAGNVPSIGTGSWSVISGTATVINPTVAASPVNGLTVETVVLNWVISNGSCSPSTSSMSIQIFDEPGIASAGGNQTVCSSVPAVSLAANSPSVGSGLWTILSGGGTVVTPTLATSTATGLATGIHQLQWQLTNGSCISTSSLTIEVDSVPDVANAGPDQFVCYTNPTVTLNGNPPAVGTGSWSLISGTGALGNSTLAVTTATNLGMGTNIFEWAISNGVCTPNTSTMAVTVSSVTALANAGSDQTLCISTPTAALSANTATAGTGTWSVLIGSGVVTSPTMAATTVTNLSVGINQLVWILNGGGCINSDTMIIQMDAQPDNSMAGNNQTLCISSPSTNLAANTPTMGTGLWTTLIGGGLVTTVTLATSPVTSLSSGTNILEWTISNGVCAPSTSTVLIQVDAGLVTANAGSDQTVCASSSIIALAAGNPTLGAGIWTFFAGNGTITAPGSYSSTVTGIIPEVDVFVWTVTNGGCSASDTVQIQVDDVPDVANAGSNQTLCISSPSATLGASSPTLGVGSWLVLTGSGTVSVPTQTNSIITGLSTGDNYLQWTVSNGVCSPNTSTVDIYVDNLATQALAGGDQTICISTGSTTVSGNTPGVGTGSWSVISGNAAVVSSTLVTSVVNSVSVGLNALEWRITNGSCSSADTMVIQVDDLPDVANAGVNQTLCISSPSTTLAAYAPTVGVGSWLTLTGGGAVATQTLANSTVSGLTLGNNILQWTVSNGVCASNVATMSIQVDNLAVQASAGGDQTLCISTGSAVLSGNTPSVGSGSWLVLTGGGSVQIPSAPSTTVTNLTVNLNLFEWTISNGGCSSSDTVAIQADDVPDISNAGSTQSLCVSSPSTNLAANSPTTGIGTWSVISGSGTVAVLTSPTSAMTGLSLGSNFVEWIVSNGVCPANTSTVDIFVNTLGTSASAGTDQIICISTGSVLLAGNTPGIGTGSWTVLAGSGTVTAPGTGNSPATGLSVGLNTFEWGITNGGCISLDTVNMQVDDVPDIANAGSDQTLCISTPSAILAAATPSNGTGVWTVLTGGGLVTTPTLQISSVTGLGQGLNILQWTLSNGVCASNSATMSLQVDNLATPAFAGNDQTVCVSSASVQLSGNVPTSGNGQWSVITGSGSVNNPTLALSTLTNIAAGITTLQWNITNGTCYSSDTVSILVDDLSDIASAGSNQTICINTASVSLAANTPSLGTGTWSVISGSGAVTNSNIASTSMTGFTTGITLLQWSIVNGVCAPNTSTVSIQADDLPTPAIAGLDQTICATSANIAANIPAVGTGSWSVVSGSATVTAPTQPNSSVINLSGTTLIQWSIFNGACGSSSDTLSIDVANPTGPVQAGNDTATCQSSVTLSANTPQAGVGAWTLLSGTANIADTSNAQTGITNLGIGITIFRWTVSNGSCPVQSDTVMITRNQPEDTARISGGDTTIHVTQLTLHANAPVVGTGMWELASGYCVFSNQVNGTCLASGFNSGANMVKWKITGACGFTQDSITITVEESVMPNAISPNGDGKNDFFEVPDIHKYSSVELTVLNRWGSIVYEDKHYANKWNGTNEQSTPLAEDTYFYTLKMDGTTKTGFVIVKR